jgi:hypothetical protein
MNSLDRLNLKKLIDETQCEDNTEYIRKVKHSVKLRDNIRLMENLKQKHAAVRAMDPQRFAEMCQGECIFLFNNYTDIFNKVLKDELNLEIMTKLLHVLKTIEDGKVDQHEGSAMVGQILKELYVDSALKRSENLDKEYGSVEPEAKAEPKPISWRDFKTINEAA